MISRYSTPEMTNLWSEDNKIKNWIKIEQVVNQELIKSKIIPENQLDSFFTSILTENAETWDYQAGPLSVISIKRFADKYEKEIQHDVNAFVFALEEFINSYFNTKDGRWIHYGLTSSDLLDTANAITIQQSIYLIDDKIKDIILVISKLINKYKEQLLSGRTHGQYAENITLESFFKRIQEDLLENLRRFSEIINSCSGKISGAVGNNRIIPVEIEWKVLKQLNLFRTSNATQIIQREWHARVIMALALLASSIEKAVLQIRLYQQSGIEEMSEPFHVNQTGSSAMPHKHNPVLCENLTGLARVVRSYVIPALENISLWQERDISHSSVERIILPDAFNLIHFMLKRFAYIISGLNINIETINAHLIADNSQDKLLDFIKQGYGRQEAYRMVQGK